MFWWKILARFPEAVAEERNHISETRLPLKCWKCQWKEFDSIDNSAYKTGMENFTRVYIHEKKLVTLSKEQDRPLLNVSSTVITLGLCTDLPNYVRETLSLGPKSAVLDMVNPKILSPDFSRFSRLWTTMCISSYFGSAMCMHH